MWPIKLMDEPFVKPFVLMIYYNRLNRMKVVYKSLKINGYKIKRDVGVVTFLFHFNDICIYGDPEVVRLYLNLMIYRDL